MENEETKEINLSEFLHVFVRHWLTIVVAAICLAAIVFLFLTYTTVPEYSASTKLYVNNMNHSSSTGEQERISTADLDAAKRLVQTYCAIAETRLTLEEVIRRGNLPYDYDELYDMMASRQYNETEILEIRVISEDPEESARVANLIAEVLSEQITRIIDGSSCQVVDYAVEPDSALSRGRTSSSIIGGLVGAVLAYAFWLIVDVFVNDRIESENWVKETFGEKYPLLAVIPDVTVSQGSYGKYSSYYRKHHGEEQEKVPAGGSANEK